MVVITRRQVLLVVVPVVGCAVLWYFGFAYINAVRQQRLWREAELVRRIARSDAMRVQGREFVSPHSGPVMYDGVPVMSSFSGSPFEWSVPPPSGKPIPLRAEANEKIAFFAYSASSRNGKRMFIFPAPEYMRILRDSDVDWNTQTFRGVLPLR